MQGVLKGEMNGFMDMDESETLPVILCAPLAVSLISKLTKRHVFAALLTGVQCFPTRHHLVLQQRGVKLRTAPCVAHVGAGD